MSTALSAVRPDPATPLRSRWLILAVLCLAQLTVVLDNTVLTVAVPVLTTELDASTTDIQWMINAYALVQCGLLLTAGSAADRYGRRRMLVAGLVLFGVGSLAAGLARSGDQLIAARAGMGIGGALLVTATLAVAMQVFDGAERSRAIGIWAATSALGYTTGPPIGGIILAHLPWGANLPGQRAHRADLPGGRPGPGAGVPGPGRRATRHRRGAAVHRRPHRRGLGHHCRPRTRLDRTGGARRGRRRCAAAGRVVVVGTAHRRPHAGHDFLTTTGSSARSPGSS